MERQPVSKNRKYRPTRLKRAAISDRERRAMQAISFDRANALAFPPLNSSLAFSGAADYFYIRNKRAFRASNEAQAVNR